MSDASALARGLLAPGPNYLIDAFRDPENRERRLQRIAASHRLGVAFHGDDGHATTSSYSERWLALLRRAAARVPAADTRAELEAVVRALDDFAAGRAGRKTTVWEQAAKHLRETTDISESTLRTRRWPTIRLRLAEQLAVLMAPTPADPLPHRPSEPQLFDSHDFRRLLDRLNGDLAGLAVLIDESGAGKTEYALAYAQWARASAEGRRRYDFVGWLRGDDELALARDYLCFGRAIESTQTYTDPYNVLEALHSTDRWLLVVDDVREPARLLRYLPRRINGHVVCTVDSGARWPRDVSKTQFPTASISELNDAAISTLRKKAWAPWQKYFSVGLDETHRVLLPMVRAEHVIRLMRHHEIPCDDVQASEILAQMGTSRLALDLAATWLRTYGGGPTAVDDYLAGLAKARRDLLDRATRHLLHRVDDCTVVSAGLVAAYMLLREAQRNRTSFDAIETPTEDDSAFLLLQQLSLFAPHPIPVTVLRTNDDDRRLRRLESLRLAVRHRFLEWDECFEVHADVRRAMRHLTTERLEDRRSLTVAAVTVRASSTADPDRPNQPMSRAMLPHTAALARRLAGVASRSREDDLHLPLTAVELFARVATTHWLEDSPLDAASAVRSIAEVLLDDTHRERVITDIAAGREGGWDVSFSARARNLLDAVNLESPSKRLHDLIVTLRRAGFRVGARDVFSAVEPLIGDARKRSASDPRLKHDHAMVLFEGALCFRANNDEKRTATHLRQAYDLFDAPADLAHCDTLAAVVALDRGDLREAKRFIDASLATRCALASRNEPDHASAWAALARSYFVLARWGFYAGLADAMLVAAHTAVEAWNFEERPQIHRATARANAALALAILRSPTASDVASAAIDEADASLGRHHHDAALVRLNQACVDALGDQPLRAAEAAQDSFRVLIRHWPRRHPQVLQSRLLVAMCLGEGGRPLEALDHLMLLLEDAGLAGTPGTNVQRAEPRRSVRAAAWVAIGRLLVDLVPHVTVDPETDLELVPRGLAPAPQCLRVAQWCFETGRRLIATNLVVTPADHVPVDLVHANLGLVEVGLRRGRPDPELATATLVQAQEAAALDRKTADKIRAEAASLLPNDVPNGGAAPYAYSIVELYALAKLIRCSSDVLGSEERTSVDLWTAVLEDGGINAEPTRAFSARDRIEFALARQKLLLDRHGPGSAEPMTSEDEGPIKEYGLWLEKDIILMRDGLQDGSHPLLSLSYSALAQLPGKSIGHNHRRARNLREVERFRVFLAAEKLRELERKLAAAADEEGTAPSLV